MSRPPEIEAIDFLLHAVPLAAVAALGLAGLHYSWKLVSGKLKIAFGNPTSMPKRSKVNEIRTTGR